MTFKELTHKLKTDSFQEFVLVMQERKQRISNGEETTHIEQDIMSRY